MRINGVPIDIFLHPVFRLVLAEQISQRLHLPFAGDDEQTVAFVDFGRRVGKNHLAVAPQTRHHEASVRGVRHDVVNRMSEQRRIAHTIGSDVGLLVVVFLTRVVVTLQPTAHNHQHHDNPDHADGVGHRTTQGGHRRRLPELFERLLCRTECGGVGRRSAKHAHQIREGQPTHQRDQHCQHRADEHHPDTQDIENRTAVAESRHKTRTDVQPECIDEEDQAETLGIGQHLRIEFQSQGTGQNAGKEHERNAEADAPKPELGQRQTEGAHGRQDDDSLNGGRASEEVDKPHVEWIVEKME